MKRLGLLRHAKSDWGDPSLADFDRPLNARGRDAAQRMGEAFARLGVAFDVALVSPARRAAETFALVCGCWPAPPEVRPEPRLYGASVGDLLAIIADSPPAANSVLLVGHNPGLHELAVQLVGGDPGAAGLRTKLPTGTLVEIRLDRGNWEQAASARCRLLRLLRPRELD